MTAIEQLVAIEAIKQLKARYFRCMDERDWTGLAGTLCEDIDFEHPTVGRHHSAAATLQALQLRLGALAMTVHHGNMPEITVHTADEASGIWSLHSCVIRAVPVGAQAAQPLHGYGRYHDTYRRVAGSWRIQTLRLEHLYKQA